MAWSSLPIYLRDLVHTISVFGRLLKTFLVSDFRLQRIGSFSGVDVTLYKLKFYLLT